MPQTFPIFPNFISLGLEHKKEYESLIAKHPPYSDILFSTLHIWWNLGGKLSVSSLNDNLIINYDLPGDEANSGLSLVGTNAIDESLIIVIEHLKVQKMPAKLVHVPRFVIRSIKDESQFVIKDERDYDEYILHANELAELKGKKYASLRYRVNSFGRHVEDKKVVEQELDLSNQEVKDYIFKCIRGWDKLNPPNNDPEQIEYKALKQSLDNAKFLGIRNLALFIDNQLAGIAIYDQPPGKSYYILHHLKANYQFTRITDYLHFRLAALAQNNNIEFINIEMDLGIENLRNHKITLKPERFLKKYTVTLATRN